MNNLLGFVVILVLAGRAFADGLHDQDEMRIVRGVPVDPQERLYQVLITRGLGKGNPRRKVCSGVLIAKKWVLTTSSCFDYTRFLGYLMYIGTKKWCKATVTGFKIKYDDGYSLAVPTKYFLQLDATYGAPYLVMVKFSIGRPEGTPKEPAQLAYTLPKAGDKLEIAGWGATGQEVNTNCQMRKATVPMLSDEDCCKIYSKEWTYGTEFCAGLNTSRKASAGTEDEGSPLVKDGLVYGLLARVKPQGQNVTSTSLYLPFAPYKEWIDLFISGKIDNFSESETMHCPA